MNKVLLGVSLAVTLLVSACSQAPAEVPGGLGAQFGSPRDDYADVVATDAARGRVYVAGAYTGPYNEGGTTARGDVVFFRRHNRDGSLAWKVSANTEARGVTASVMGADTDGAGNVYFAWRTLTTAGSADRGFVSKYSPNGKLLFLKELPGAYTVAVATDALDNFYLATSGGASGKVEKFSKSGQRVWTKTLPIDDDSDYFVSPASLDLAADGSLYVVVNTAYDRPFLLKLRGRDGKVLKSSPVSGDYADDVEVAGGSVYVHSNLDTPFHFQPIVSSFRPDGSRMWERRGDFESDETFDNLSYDAATGGISADAYGNVYLTGTFITERDYPGRSDADVLVRKYTPSGDVAYNRRFLDPATGRSGRGVAVASGSELYVVGSTGGKVNGRSNGGGEAFLMRLNAQGQKVWER